jgi:DNA-directed RNA polymerase subunit RPC12/RpoP
MCSRCWTSIRFNVPGSVQQEMKKGPAVACRPFCSLRRLVLGGSADEPGVVSQVHG